MRLFVALPIPDALRAEAIEVVDDLRQRFDGLRWPRPEGWHVTLAFLGEVEPERVAEVAGVLDRVAAGVDPFELRSAAPGRFGRGVLWLGVEDEPSGAAGALGERIQAALADAHLPVQRQEVRPHVTLARGGKRKVTDALVAAVKAPEVAWTADRIELWSSRLGGGPARYTVEHLALLHA